MQRQGFMLEKVFRLVERVARHVRWYLWNDERARIRVTQEIAGFRVPAEFSRATREGSLSDYDLRINAYEARRIGPAETAMMLQQWIERVFIPLVPFGTQQGIAPDVEKIVVDTGKKLGIRNAQTYVKIAAPQVAMNAKQAPTRAGEAREEGTAMPKPPGQEAAPAGIPGGM
jgi:hypothetical protein